MVTHLSVDAFLLDRAFQVAFIRRTKYRQDIDHFICQKGRILLSQVSVFCISEASGTPVHRDFDSIFRSRDGYLALKIINKWRHI